MNEAVLEGRVEEQGWGGEADSANPKAGGVGAELSQAKPRWAWLLSL